MFQYGQYLELSNVFKSVDHKSRMFFTLLLQASWSYHKILKFSIFWDIWCFIFFEHFSLLRFRYELGTAPLTNESTHSKILKENVY